MRASDYSKIQCESSRVQGVLAPVLFELTLELKASAAGLIRMLLTLSLAPESSSNLTLVSFGDNRSR